MLQNAPMCIYQLINIAKRELRDILDRAERFGLSDLEQKSVNQNQRFILSPHYNLVFQ